MRMSNARFLRALEESPIGQEYLTLINTAKSREESKEQIDGKVNIHHIQPKGMQGSDIGENLVRLTEFEHCKAHALLAQIWDRFEVVKPISKLHFSQFTRLTAEQQNDLKQNFKWEELLKKSLHYKLPESSVQKISAKLRGRKQSPEEIQKRSESRRKLHDGKWYSEESTLKKSKAATGKVSSSEARAKMSRAAKRRWKDPEYRAKMVEKAKTRKRPPCSEQTKEKLRQIRKRNPTGFCSPNFKPTKEQINRKIQRRSEKLRGRENKRAANSVWVTNGKDNKRPLKEDSYLWIEKGWVYGKTVKIKR